jgi:hypothetical protein
LKEKNKETNKKEDKEWERRTSLRRETGIQDLICPHVPDSISDVYYSSYVSFIVLMYRL